MIRCTAVRRTSGHRFVRRLSGVVLVAGLLLGPARSFARPPTLTELFPPGAGRGQTVAVKATGTFDHWPVQAWIEGRGVEIRAEKEKGKLTAVVAADTAPGLRWVRLYDGEGATTPRPFVIGVLPEVIEVEPNDEPKAPQRLASSATVNGRLGQQGDVDGFAIVLTRGQSLVASLEAQRPLGSPMDAVLQVVSEDGFVLAQNDDDVGPDPRIVFEAPAAGTYIVRVFAFPAKPNSTIRFAGASDYVYRLTLTTGGFIDYAFPLAVGQGGPNVVEAIGWNIPAAARALPIPEWGLGDIGAVAHAALADTASVRRVPFAATVETEPNDLSRPQAIASPIAISGRIDPPGDLDVFRFALRKDDNRVIRVESRALGRPLDPTLRILDPSGKILAESDDTNRNDRDLERSFTAPADGEYRLVVRDLNGQGGPRFAYLLSVRGPRPDFNLSLAADQFALTPGKPSRIAVTIQRRESLAEPIEIVAEDLPAGITAQPVASKPEDASARSVSLELSAGDRAGSGPFRIVGRTTKDPRTSHAATAPIAGFTARTDQPWVTVRRSGAANPK
jgi:hypothetical protein